VFLVLRRLALVGDAISHVLLFGIVLAYFATRDLDSPWLFIGAAASGVLTVALVELLQRTRLVKEDAAIGLVFPALFAAGALLASMHLRNTHLDVDAVLLGHAELAVYTRPVSVGPVYLGRQPTVVMAGLFVVNVALVALFYKELKLSTFDAALAATLGFLPGVLHYGLMAVVSLTTVAAFDAVGPVLVVAFLVVPAATAFLLTDRLPRMLLLSVLTGVVASVAGVGVAFRIGTNTAGTVASVLGVEFVLALFFAPGRGLAAQVLRRWRQRREFHVTVLAIHLYQHEGTPAEPDEARADGLHRHLHWDPARVAHVVGRAERAGVVTRSGELLKLTAAGRERARDVLGERA
jgi:manganese/zinc/iron transport system permease protein